MYVCLAGSVEATRFLLQASDHNNAPDTHTDTHTALEIDQDLEENEKEKEKEDAETQRQRQREAWIDRVDEEGWSAAALAIAFDHHSVLPLFSTIHLRRACMPEDSHPPSQRTTTTTTTTTSTRKCSVSAGVDMGEAVGNEIENDREEGSGGGGGGGVGIHVGTDIGVSIGMEEGCPIHVAARWGAVRSLACLVSLLPIPIPIPAASVHSPLPMLSTQEGATVPISVAVLVLMLVNARLADGSTPLHLAARYGHLSMCQTLVTLGANPYPHSLVHTLTNNTPTDSTSCVGSRNNDQHDANIVTAPPCTPLLFPHLPSLPPSLPPSLLPPSVPAPVLLPSPAEVALLWGRLDVHRYLSSLHFTSCQENNS